jgi:hypothetical protein
VILTRLAGGLGNQLFQYAAGRSLAARLGVELKLDSSWIEGDAGTGPGTQRRFCLEPFRLPFELVSARRVARLPPRTRREALVYRWLPTRRPVVTTLVQSSGAELDRRIFAASDDTCLQGFWESERYFAEHAELIRGELRLPDPPEPVAALLDEIERRVAVSVHVRRGDRAAHPGAGGRFVSLTPSWYARAFEELARRTGHVDAAYVFSDDPTWCREHLTLPCEARFVVGNLELDDLRLMSRCRHHIVANSTFSWWGAWLDARPGAVVVAPARWRNDRETPDAVPASWITLQV